MSSFLLRITNRGDGQPGSNLTLFRADGERWHASAGPESIPALDCAGDSADRIREFFLTTTSRDTRFATIAQCLWTTINLPSFEPVWGDAFRDRTTPFHLFVAADGELGGVPWELLTRSYPQCLLLRCPDWQPAASAPVWPVRIMVVVGARRGDRAVKAEEELGAIRRAVRNVNRSIFMKEVLLPTADDLLTEMKLFCPHVLHFIGHGGPSVEDESEPALKFDLAGGASWDWTRPLIRSMLHDYEQDTSCRLRLVYLNACRSLSITGGAATAAAPSLSDQKITYDLSTEFLQRARAVLAMQSDVDGTMAGVFADQVYSGVASGKPLDAAIASARSTVQRQSNIDRRDPYVACLILKTPVEQIIPVPGLDSDRQSSISRTKAFEVVSRFVGRQDLRNEFFSCLQPPCQQIPKHTIYVVQGPNCSESFPHRPGKTWFVNWCMEACMRHGYDVRWISVIGGQGSIGLIELMRAIRDGDPREALSALHRPIEPKASFAEFNFTINTLLSGGVWKPPEPGLALAPDNNDPMDVDRLNDQQFVDRICSAFQSALLVAGAGAPLLLVLDDFVQGTSAFPRGHFQIFFKKVLVGLEEHERRPVRVMLVVTEKFFRDNLDDLPSALYKMIDLKDFPAEAFPEIAMEYLELTSPSVLAKRSLVAEMAMTRKDTIGYWRIAYLKEYAEQVAAVLGLGR
jgi:hypothetical protein